MISASALERVDLCPVSEVLPHRREVESDWCSQGHAVHGFLEEVPKLGRDEALARVDEKHRAACEQIDVEQLPAIDGNGYAVEVAFALDVATGEAREVGRNIGRNYGELMPTEIPGTADVVGLAADGETVIVHDYKTGWGDVTEAERNWQLRFLALAAARAYGRKRAHVSIIRIRGDRDPWYDRAAFDEFDLAKAWSDLMDLLGRVDAATLTTAPTIGPHCRYCPAFGSCPANVSLARDVVSGSDAPFGELTPDNAAEVYMKVKAARKILDEIDGAVRTLAAQEGGLDLGNGKVLRQVEQARDYVDGGRALYLVRAEFGPEAANEAFEIKTSKSAIEKLVGEAAKARGEKMAPARREFIERLRKAKAIRSHVSVSVAERSAPKTKANK